MILTITGPIWYWRGPAPHHFVTVPAEQSALLKQVSSDVTYGWGMIPVRARLGQTEFKTSLFPKNGVYIIPIKTSVQEAEQVGKDDTVTIELWVG